jgi:hypothetical protein
MANLLTIGSSFIAILAGFVTMAVLVMVTTGVLTKAAPGFVSEGERPRLPYMVFNLGFSAAYAMLGGWVTARLVPVARNPLTHSLMLAIIVLVLGALNAIQFRGKQPAGYQIVLTALSPLAVLAGGLLRMHQLGFRW